VVSYEIHLDSVAARFLRGLMLQLALNLLFFGRARALDIARIGLAAIHLPFHEFVECTTRVVGELLIGALFGYLALGVDANDTIRALNRRETMRNADSSVVVFQELA
jgi:hypothetical protein